MNIQVVSTIGFINNLTKGKLNYVQANRANAYLRAKGMSFYDNFRKEHCSILSSLENNKLEVLNALRYTLSN